ncbi:hypothetical protein DP144_13790 [Clostridium tetani]|uniref:SH3 domain-containing protein n=1 Tax=Clostridium tetani TaxID=1513 RepID=UPI00100ADD94|nr:SH3 domain-containing protein [Clostridium tetani]RXM73677.1 hypothetical protein DP154_13700 [Clostridium tetani]RYU97833.1 hypothetical protein DP144_13790 [Clostridium tetani]
MKKTSAFIATIMSIGLLSGTPVCAQEKSVSQITPSKIQQIENNKEDQGEVLADIEFRTRAINGIITANGVRLRKTPGLSGTILRQLNKWDRVMLTKSPRKAVDGYWWQEVIYGNLTGWVAVNYFIED